MPLKSLENLLNRDGSDGLGDVVRKAREMGDLVTRLQESLGAEAGAHVRAANIRDDGTLVVLASSPAWASRLRFEEDRLLAAARDSGADVSACQVRVSRGD